MARGSAARTSQRGSGRAEPRGPSRSAARRDGPKSGRKSGQKAGRKRGAAEAGRGEPAGAPGPIDGRTAEALSSDEVLEMVAARFRVLGDPSRLTLLRILMDGECSVQDLVDASGLSQTNVSRHLGLMRRDGAVERTRDGNRSLYRIADPTIERVCAAVCDGLTRRASDDLAALQGGSGI